MQGEPEANSEPDAPLVTANPAVVARRALRAARSQLAEDRATSTRAAIASSLFLVVLACSLLLGGHAAIDPILRSAMMSHDSNGTGDVLYAMPDGVYCRHVSFDNATAEVAETAIAHCPDDIVREHARRGRGFAWGH
jgi:hypothetical protein